MIRALSFLAMAAIASTMANAQRSQPRPTKDSTPPQVTYTYVEVMPKFNGDIKADVLAKLRIPEPCMEMSPGKCVAAFTVEPTGLLTDLTIARSSGCTQLDSEIVRLLIPMTTTPRWIPGRQQGKPAAVKFALPVIVHLDD